MLQSLANFGDSFGTGADMGSRITEPYGESNGGGVPAEELKPIIGPAHTTGYRAGLFSLL